MAALLVVVAAGCNHGATLEAKVVTMPSRAPDGSYVPERPLAGASVALECDAGPAAQRFESDANGRVSARFPEPLANGCRLNVEKAGFRPRVYRVLDVCASGHATECQGVSFSARLLPETAP